MLLDEDGRGHADAGGDQCDADAFVVPEPFDAGQDEPADQATFQEPQHRPRVFLLLLALGLECEVYFLQIREDLLS